MGKGKVMALTGAKMTEVPPWGICWQSALSSRHQRRTVGLWEGLRLGAGGIVPRSSVQEKPWLHRISDLEIAIGRVEYWRKCFVEEPRLEKPGCCRRWVLKKVHSASTGESAHREPCPRLGDKYTKEVAARGPLTSRAWEDLGCVMST